MMTKNLHQLIADMRAAQDELRKVYAVAQDAIWQNRRQDGPTGFVMVRPAPPAKEQP
jgi:hypothetical protein